MQRDWIMAGSMILFGALIYAAASRYTSKPQEAVSAETLPVKQAEETEPETETPETEPETESSHIAVSDDLNLAYEFPDGIDKTDASNSYAAQIFDSLTRYEESWLSSVYSYAGSTPGQLAERLGRDRSSYTGGYDPGDEEADPNDPSTWEIRSFHDIRMQVSDGDGNPVSLSSNVIDIMSMANVYTYYHDISDQQLFLDYARALWEHSHSFSISMSDVYYCTGCLDDVDEETGEDESEIEDEIQEPYLVSAAEFSESDTAAEAESAVEESSASRVITSGRGLPETGAETDTETAALAETEAETEMTIMETETVPDSTGSADTETESQSESADDEQLLQTPSDARNAEFPASTENPGNCPGHVDLIVSLRILDTDGTRNLFTVDSYGNQTENVWEGWTEENVDAVRRLAARDWYADYGLSLSSMGLGTPLSVSEIDEYMSLLPEGLSEERRRVVRFALSSVGRVPYYWGGKAVCSGYEGNHFGELTGSDYKGRVLRGLDCSGWINWVYWSATGNRLEYESTLGLVALGTEISREDLLPGDIILRTGDDAHVIMFLEWTEDGRIRCIHESSDGVNNVTVSERDANWPCYRRLIE